MNYLCGRGNLFTLNFKELGAALKRQFCHEGDISMFMPYALCLSWRNYSISAMSSIAKNCLCKGIVNIS